MAENPLNSRGKRGDGTPVTRRLYHAAGTGWYRGRNDIYLHRFNRGGTLAPRWYRMMGDTRSNNTDAD